MMDIYVCSICGHEYNPEKGEPAQGIAPGIEFLNLPADWLCPVCTASKDKFRKKM
jgi:rubredoxin